MNQNLKNKNPNGLFKLYHLIFCQNFLKYSLSIFMSQRIKIMIENLTS